MQAVENIASSISSYGIFTTLFFFTIIISLYGIFVYYFYKNLARRNLINLDLNQYNTTEHPMLGKFFAFLFYVLEYLIILPILTFIWFAVLAIFLVVLSEIDNVGTILMICAALIASVRVVSQISGQLSQDLAKIVPFTLLGLFILNPGFFDLTALVNRFSQIPVLISQIPIYIFFIIGVEILARVIGFFERMFRTRGEIEEE